MKKKLISVALLSLLLCATKAQETHEEHIGRFLIVKLAEKTSSFERKDLLTREEGQVSFFIELNPHTDFYSARKMVNRYIRNSGYFRIVKNWRSHESNAEVLHIMDGEFKVYLIAYIREENGSKLLAVIFQPTLEFTK